MHDRPMEESDCQHLAFASKTTASPVKPQMISGFLGSSFEKEPLFTRGAVVSQPWELEQLSPAMSCHPSGRFQGFGF